MVPSIPVGGVVGVVGVVVVVVVVTLTLPVDVVWPAPGVVAPVEPAVAGEVVAGAPAVLYGGTMGTLGFSRLSRWRTDRRVRNFMGNLKLGGEKKSCVARFQSGDSFSFSRFLV